VALLIVDSDAVAAVLDDDDATVARDRGSAAAYELDRLLIMRRIGRIVVVDEDVGVGAVRALKDHVVAVRADGLPAIGEAAARSCDRDRGVGLAVVEVDRAVGIVDDVLPVGAHHRAEMVAATRGDTGDRRRIHYEWQRCGGNDDLDHDRIRRRCSRSDRCGVSR
jgi:hypothetical protein